MTQNGTRLRAIIFDFDGLILETEYPEFAAWSQVYRDHGYELDVKVWVTVIGTFFNHTTFDPYRDLQQKLGDRYDEEAIKARRREVARRHLADLVPLPGAEDLIRTAKDAGLKLAVASSSKRSWVEGHLSRYGLLTYFDAVRTSDDVENIKPAPDLYLAALAALELEPTECVVLEDSAYGITAANTAGIYTIAVPNELSSYLDLSHANLKVRSLTELSIPRLQELLA